MLNIESKNGAIDIKFGDIYVTMDRAIALSTRIPGMDVTCDGFRIYYGVNGIMAEDYLAYPATHNGSALGVGSHIHTAAKIVRSAYLKSIGATDVQVNTIPITQLYSVDTNLTIFVPEDQQMCLMFGYKYKFHRIINGVTYYGQWTIEQLIELLKTHKENIEATCHDKQPYDIDSIRFPERLVNLADDIDFVIGGITPYSY